MDDLGEFIKDSIENPPALYDFVAYYKPDIFYVINDDTKEVLFAFMDIGFPSHESLTLLRKLSIFGIGKRIVNKDFYEEEIKPFLR